MNLVDLCGSYRHLVLVNIGDFLGKLDIEQLINSCASASNIYLPIWRILRALALQVLIRRNQEFAKRQVYWATVSQS